MAVKWSTKTQNVALDAIKTAFADGIIEIYSGSQPVNALAAVQGTLLGIVTVGAGAFVAGSPTNGLEFSSASSGTLSKNPSETWQFTGLANGEAGWYRFKGNAADPGTLDTGTSYHRMDGRIATSGAEMNMGSTTVELGRVSTIDSFSIPTPSSYK